jgi:hypothetical protein
VSHRINAIEKYLNDDQQEFKIESLKLSVLDAISKKADYSLLEKLKESL